MIPRSSFTQALIKLLSRMLEDGEEPLIDYVKRSTQEQKRLFEQGLSKCDGEKVKSAHQLGRAADVYLVTKDNKLKDWTVDGLGERYHKIWEELGGKPMITWDQGHFEW